MEPRPEVGPRLETAQLFVCAQERLLDHVLGVLRAAGHPVRESIDGTAVTLDKRPESFAISIAGQRDGGGVRLRHPDD